MAFYSLIRDTELLTQCFRAINDWMLEFGADAPNRIRPVMMLNVDDPAVAVSELHRTYEQGARAALIPVKNPHGYHNSRYEPLWRAAEELDVPLVLHVITSREPQESHTMIDSGYASVVNSRDYQVRWSLTEIILSGVLEKHPTLKLVSIENEGSWAPYFMERLDWEYNNSMLLEDSYRFKDGMSPSDLFKRNVYISFTEDPILVELRHQIGVDHLTWGSDFPHAEATYPETRSIVARQLANIPAEERRAITVDTCAQLFKLSAA
jgi:predicted TIM-barrel fold metal-dependent hydrolase